jgi:uncharacterized protein (TIGR02147 family)
MLPKPPAVSKLNLRKMWQRFFSQLLQNAFDAAVAADPALSLRGFARRLDVSPGVLSEIFRNQRKISAARALEIARAAQLDAAALAQLEKLMSLKAESSREILSGEAIELVMNPEYYRLLCALEVLPVPATIEEITRFLGFEPKALEAAVRRLESFGILYVEGTQIYWGGRYVTTTEDIPSEKIREFHRQALRQAGDDLALPVQEREYTSVIFAGCHARLPEAKNQIRIFRDELSDAMRDAKPDSVYQLSIQLRPLSRVFSPEVEPCRS